MVRLDEDLKKLIDIPVYLEGDAPKDLPNEYFTVSEDWSGDNLNADNKALEHRYEFTLKWYTKDASRIYTGLLEAIELLKSNGYLIEGTGYKNETYQNTWFSRMVDVEKIDYLK